MKNVSFESPFPNIPFARKRLDPGRIQKSRNLLKGGARSGSDLCELDGKLGERRELTPAETIRKEREKWAAVNEEEAAKALEEFRKLQGMGKEMWEAIGLTPDEYVRKEREGWD